MGLRHKLRAPAAVVDFVVIASTAVVAGRTSTFESMGQNHWLKREDVALVYLLVSLCERFISVDIIKEQQEHANTRN